MQAVGGELPDFLMLSLSKHEGSAERQAYFGVTLNNPPE